jgi:5'-nucleotidase
MKTPEILYVDLDDTLNFYSLHLLSHKKDPTHFPQSEQGFYLSIKPIAEGIKSILELSTIYDIYFLTAPSLKNPHSYMEKRLWIEKHFGYEWVHKLIICNHKHLLIGNYLIDDCSSGKGQDKFTGELIHYGSSTYPSWDSIFKYLKTKHDNRVWYENTEKEILKENFPEYYREGNITWVDDTKESF